MPRRAGLPRARRGWRLPQPRRAAAGGGPERGTLSQAAALSTPRRSRLLGGRRARLRPRGRGRAAGATTLPRPPCSPAALSAVARHSRRRGGGSRPPRRPACERAAAPAVRGGGRRGLGGGGGACDGPRAQGRGDEARLRWEGGPGQARHVAAPPAVPCPLAPPPRRDGNGRAPSASEQAAMSAGRGVEAEGGRAGQRRVSHWDSSVEMRSSKCSAWSRRRFRERAALSRFRILRAACLSPAAARCWSSSSGMVARGRRVAPRLAGCLPDGNLLLRGGAERSRAPAWPPACAKAGAASDAGTGAAGGPGCNLPGLRPDRASTASSVAAMGLRARADAQRSQGGRSAGC